MKARVFAWGWELLLKAHEKIETKDYPLQLGDRPCDYGFGDEDRKEILKEYNLNTYHEEFDSLSGFKIAAKKESFKGFPLIVSVLDHVSYDDSENQDHRPIFHIWLVTWEDGSLCYRSREYLSSHVVELSQVDDRFHHSFQHLGHAYKIDCLLHSLS